MDIPGSSSLAKATLFHKHTRRFECKRSMCHEDQFNGERSPDELISSRLTISDDESPFQSFSRHLRHYTSRKLKHRSGAYDAFFCISKLLYDDDDDDDKWVTSRTDLPTWSWSSIMGLSDDDQIHYQATEVFNISPDSNNPDDDWQIYMAIACREGCVAEHIPSLLFFPTTHDFVVRPGGVIATKCQAAFLHLSPRPSYSSNIINEDGERIGELCGDTARLRREQGLWLLRLAMAHHRTSRSNSLPFRCLASGSCLIGPKKSYDVNGNALAKVPIVNVLMITRDGDFARRRELWLGMLG
ncbi:uncharacterized protein PADG_04017 [Paracoccidioides brasiliensis Pb18]|uniref:Uncharacterized protein n=1 Tax=Paracoccidioides brasiliensis (strain Pb18) TaxID=502780 RepID=C1G9T1_PARBD|nr:uncharacterized protein PADG_04017 [Paracoccidioides brasiliensis Pb18]EEH47933.2 hypothetical protein PADG_04017 [Paracoccidioides brasiliensis Pb18]